MARGRRARRGERGGRGRRRVCCESFVSATEKRCLECTLGRWREVHGRARCINLARADDLNFIKRVEASSSNFLEFLGGGVDELVISAANESNAPVIRWLFEESSCRAEAKAYVEEEPNGSNVLGLACGSCHRKMGNDVDRLKYLFETLGLRPLLGDDCLASVISLDFSLSADEREKVVKRQLKILKYLHEEQDLKFEQHHLCQASKQNDCVESIEYMYNNGVGEVPTCALEHAFKYLNARVVMFYIEKCDCVVNLRREFILVEEIWKDDEMFHDYAERVFSGSFLDYLDFFDHVVRMVVFEKARAIIEALRNRLKKEDDRDSIIVRDIMSLVDEHKQNFTENKYLEICAFLKKKHDLSAQLDA